jgi:hypothetical protein
LIYLQVVWLEQMAIAKQVPTTVKTRAYNRRAAPFTTIRFFTGKLVEKRGAAVELETQPTATRLSKMIRPQRDSSDARHDARHGSKAFCAAKEESRRPTWNRSDHSDRGDFRRRLLVLAGVGPRKSAQTHCTQC